MSHWLQAGTNILVIIVAIVLLTTSVGPFPQLWDDYRAGRRVAVEWPSIAQLAVPIGSDEGILNAVIVSDYSCTYCRAMHEDISDLLQQRPNIRIGYLHYPIRGLNSDAGKAAKAATCALYQDRFEEAHDRLFEAWRSIPSQDFNWEDFPISVGVTDFASFNGCMSSSETTEVLEEHVALVDRIGFKGTPMIFFPTAVHTGRMSMPDFIQRLN